MKTSELIGPALDWTVAKIESGCKPEYFNESVWITTGGFFTRVRRNVYSPSTNWAQGGPIIERELLCVIPDSPRKQWRASTNDAELMQFGPTPLIAAMRSYVASKLGDEIEIPEELQP